MEKIQWQRGGGEISWNSILPPPKCVLPLKCPPQIPRLGAATAHGYMKHLKQENH